MTEKNNQEKQQKFMEMQLMMQHMQQLQQQSQMVEQQFLELKQLEENLTQLGEVKENTKSYSLIGAGIYSESELKDTKKVLMKVSRDIAVKKTIPEVLCTFIETLILCKPVRS